MTFDPLQASSHGYSTSVTSIHHWADFYGSLYLDIDDPEPNPWGPVNDVRPLFRGWGLLRNAHRLCLVPVPDLPWVTGYRDLLRVLSIINEE